jgi:hypothetical protein
MVPLAPRIAGVHHADDLLDTGNPGLEIVVETLEAGEEGWIEDVRCLERDDDAVVAAELLAELVVRDLDGVLCVEERVGRNVGLQKGNAADEHCR